ncbi:MAG TPA: hypothetical protein VG034_19515 [Acidimicrobiia bacterium]|nr:hypothetical protein [Acidimicrobiia bacterium]
MQTIAVTRRARTPIARLATGLTVVAVLSAACGRGSDGTDVQASPQAAPAGAVAAEHGSLHAEVHGQSAGSTTDGAAKLRQTLTAALQEHEYLAGIAVAQAVVTKKTDSPEFTAAAAALDKNSVALSEAIGSIYGKAAGDAFLPLWRKHIGFFVDYTVGKLTNDTVKATKAMADLDGYRADFGAFLASANPNLTKDAVAQALVPHVTATFAAIDAVVAGDGTGFEKLRIAAGHMPMLAETLAGAIAKQFPAKFAGDTGSAASGLLATLTAALQEHEYLAGIAVDMAAITKDPNSALFKAAAEALDKNSVGLADAVNSIYPGTKDVFLASWRKHIGFFVDYTLGKLTNDAAKAAKAKTDLDGYRADFGALLNSVNPNLPKDAVAEALIPHVTATFAAIDAVVAGDGTGFEKLRVAAGHMPMLAGTLAGAIAQQFPAKFPATAAAAGGSDLPRTH